MLKKLLHGRGLNQVYALAHQVTMAGYGFLVLFLMVRMMPQTEVGRWLVFLSVLSISDMLMQGLLQTILIKETTVSKGDILNMHSIQNNGAILALLLVTLISLVAFLVNNILNATGHAIGVIDDFSSWYPFVGLVMILFNLGWWVNTGKEKFKIIFIQRVVFSVASLLTLLIFYFLDHELSFHSAIVSQLVGYTTGSIFSWSVNRFVFSKKYIQAVVMKRFVAYGKYNMGTMLGSSLLRNADTFMIAAFMNSGAVAIYTLAQKIIEIFEVALRSVAATFLPLLHALKDDSAAFASAFLTRVVLLMLLFLPAAVLIFFYADEVIQLFSGSDQYGLSAKILKVFMIYVFFLPADRLMGIALEAANLPKLNMLKTMLLITVNISGNLIALYYYQSLTGVAAVSILALSTGISAGLFFLHKSGTLKLSRSMWQTVLVKPKWQG